MSKSEDDVVFEEEVIEGEKPSTPARGSWFPAMPVSLGEDEIVVAVDPRVAKGPFPVSAKPPVNPPPPTGWSYWKERQVPVEAMKLTLGMLHDAHEYPMGSFVQTVIEGELVAARVEWHNIQGATGKRGCFRGVNLMRRYPLPPKSM